VAKRQDGGPGNNSSGNNGGHAHSESINVGHTERQLSMVAGTSLAVYGLLQRSTSGFLLAALGGVLIWRGHTGHCQVYQTLGHSSADRSTTKDAGHLEQSRPSGEVA